MKPLATLTPGEASRLSGVLFDLDDTLLTHGVLTRAAYGALWDLREAGLQLVAVTGRPSGWGEVVARQWPIEAAVTENGAVVIARERGAVRVIDACSGEERRRRRVRLAALIERVREIVPEARLADDVGARTSDVTWDIGESVRLPEDRVQMIAGEIARAKAHSTRSSVHLHASYDTHDKASGSIGWLSKAFGVDPGSALSRYAFVGDSGNDRACFSAFHTTFGVANVVAAAAQLPVLPRYVSRAKMGEGFAEIARALLAARAK